MSWVGVTGQREAAQPGQAIFLPVFIASGSCVMTYTHPGPSFCRSLPLILSRISPALIFWVWRANLTVNR